MTSPGLALHTGVVPVCCCANPERFPRNPDLHDPLVRLQNSAPIVVPAQRVGLRAGGAPFERSKPPVSPPQVAGGAI